MAEHTPHATANMLGITPVTLRRWCAAHAAYLSPLANPPERGTARRFTGKDIEVLKHVQSLRAHGTTEAKINEQLRTLTFAEIDNSEQDTDIVEAPQDAQDAQNALDAQHSTPALTVALFDLERRIDAKIEAIQRSREPSFVVGLGLGAIGMGILFLLLIGLAVLYGMGR
jgi:DNA-binding transcriptional MerR regulator